MKTRPFLLSALTAGVAIAMAVPTCGQTVIWKDNNPADPCFSGTNNGLIINQIEDPTGDPDRMIVGEVDFSISSDFSNCAALQPAQAVAGFMQGQNYSFTIDYFVPSSTSMTADDSFFLQVIFDEGTTDSAGFIDITNVTFDTWQTIEINSVVPMEATTITPLFIFATGGTTALGTAAYVDNICCSVDAEADDTELYADADPVDSAVSQLNEGLICNPIADPTGDPDRVTVGEVDFGSAAWFSSVGPLAPGITITPEMHGVAYTYTVDYYVPADTTMSTNAGVGGQADTFYLNTFFDGENTDSVGFITVDNANFDTWKTLTLTGTIPKGAKQCNAFFVFAEGGFGGVRSPDPGVALYIDNIRFAIDLPSGGDCDFEIGDINEDGLVNLEDVNPFVDALAEGVFLCQADINQDGFFNLEDVNPFVQLLSGG